MIRPPALNGKEFSKSQYTAYTVRHPVPPKHQGITGAQICCSMNALYVYDVPYSATTYYSVDLITLLYQIGNITQLRLQFQPFCYSNKQSSAYLLRLELIYAQGPEGYPLDLSAVFLRRGRSTVVSSCLTRSQSTVFPYGAQYLE